MKKFYSLLIATIIMLAIPMGMKAAEGDVHDMSITQSTNLNNNAAIPSIEIAAQSYSVKTVTINWRYNKAIENPVTIEVLVGETSWGTQTITGNTTADAVFNGESTIGAITINFTNNTGSGTGHGTFYVNSVKLTEGEGGGPAPTTYTVTYHANVTGIDDIVDTYNEGATVTIADNTFSNPGYAFTEWNTEADGNGDSYAPGDEIEDIDDDLELYAQWEQSTTATYTYNFAGANNFYTDAALTTHPGSGSSNNVGTIYYGDGSAFVASGTNRYFSSTTSGYFMLGKADAQISLPTFEGYKITQVKLHSSTGHSTSVSVSIVSGSSTASAAQTWSTKDHDYVYDIASNYQASALTVKVTNAYNTQFTSITLVCEAYVPSSVATPTFDPADGATFGNEGLTVSIACETPNTVIYYTVDGSTPDNNSTLYEGAITLTTTATINAIAYDGTNYSDMATATYTYIDPNAPGTVNNPYTVAQARTAIDANTGTQGVYATGIVSQIVTAYGYNGYSNITFNFVDNAGDTDFLQAYRCVSTNDADASTVAAGDVVVVYGNLTKYTNSGTGATTYEFAQGCQLVSITHPAVAVEAPTFSPVAGTYAEAQSVTLSCATETATIFYTIDGTDPATSNTTQQYENPITVSSTMTIKAVAVMGQYTSNMATATYHINSAEDPYTVTEALSFAEYQYPANNIYVTGIVSTAPTSLSSGTLTYYISVDGEATNQLEVYKGKDLNNEAFTAVDDIQVGDIVTVYGNVQVYNSTIEFGSGNYLVSFERPTPVLEEYDLTVSTLDDHISAIYVFNIDEPNDPLIEEGQAGTIQVLEGTGIMVSPDVEEGYVLASLTVLDSEGTSVQPEDHMSDGGYYSFTMPSGPVTITATAMEAPATVDYELYSGALVEGDYIIYYNGYAMNHTVTSNRLQYETVTPNNNVITTSNATIVWHIAPSDTCWTIYSADAQAYAASTGVNNKAQMLDEVTDMALWSVTVAESKDNTYEFVNKYNYENQVNHLLRNNGTYGFACYKSTTGGALSLYKKVEDTPITETYELTINGYTSETTGWNLIASPVATMPDQVENMISDNNTYDLYRFNSTATGAEWENYKNPDHQNNFEIVPGQGYLYANSETVNLIFSGEIYDGDGVIQLANVGFNLVGNPYSVSAVIDREEFYVMVETEEGSKIMPAEDNTIAEMQGIFVEAEDEGERVTFTAVGKNNGNNRQEAAMVMNITQNRGSLIDRAIIRFGEGRSMSKFQLFENGSKLYIPQNGKDYAVVSASEMGEMPVSFKAAANGTYTISINTENVEMGYLHLIDNMTGNDVDLLATPYYSFNAQTTDYESRFRLVFSADNSNTGDSFAFISNGNLFINGQGTLEVFDITGRMISSADATQSVSTTELNAGVYMLRLTNGNSVKTQKIVVK